MSRLAGKVAIVTGAGSGIGRATALEFAREGARVLVVDRDAEAAAGTCAQAPEGSARSGAALVPFVQDVTAVEAPARAFAACRDAFGEPCAVLVNNAGLGHAHRADITPDEEWDRSIDINLRTVFRMSREALVAFGERGGAIVNIASIFGMVGFPRSAPYSAAKAAIIGLTRQMTADYGPRGVRVNAIAPGLIETPATAERVRRSKLFQDSLLHATPLMRIGKPIDIARAAVFLASDDASFVAGHVLVVDGGWSSTHFAAER